VNVVGGRTAAEKAAPHREAAVAPVSAAAGGRLRRVDRSATLGRAAVLVAVVPFVIAVYGVVVLGGGRLLGTGGRPNPALSVVATTLVAVSFEPLAARSRRLVARLLHGDRATPYQVMAGFARRMAGALSVEDVLPATAEAASRVVRADAGEVRVFLSGGATQTAVWPLGGGAAGGPPAACHLVVPVTHAGDTVGELAVRKRTGPGLTPADERALATLAAQAGLALHNVRLTAELEASLDRLAAQASEIHASRSRIVTARLGERRRLQRVIRSQVERPLQEAAAEMRAAGMLATSDAEGARAGLERAGTLVVQALDTLRELAQGVFPALLAQRGVVRALEAHAGTTPSPIVVRAAPGLDLEGTGIGAQTAVYFCCVEAARLARRRAPGRPVTIEVGGGGPAIEFTVRGAGLAFSGGPDATPAPSLQHLVDRLEALGGGLSPLAADNGGPGVAGRAPTT